MPRTWMVVLALTVPLGLGMVSGCGKKADVPDASPAPVASARPRLGFHLSDADPERPAARTAVKGEPMSAEATQALLARLPKLESSASPSTGATAFALRPATAPPPRPGRTVEEPFPPKPSAAPKTTLTAAKLTITRKAPEGPISIAPNLSVTFSEPMVELTSVSALAAKAPPIKLTPEPKGSFRWLGTQTLVFQPEKEFPKATFYEVEIPAGTKSLSGSKLEQSEKFSFSTPAPKLLSYAPVGSSVSTDPVIVAEFDQRMDPTVALARVHIVAEGAAIEARAATLAEIAAEDGLADRLEAMELKGKGRVLVLRAKTHIPPATRVEVKFLEGTPSAEGPRKTAQVQSWGFETYKAMAVAKGDCQGLISPGSTTPTCRPNTTFVANFTNAIDRELFDKAVVSVEPPVEKMTVSASGYDVMVHGKWHANTRYKVAIKRGVTDVFGQVSAADDTREFSVVPYDAKLFHENMAMSVADPAAGPLYPVFSTNEGPVHVRLYREEPENWEAYLAFRERWDSRGEVVTPPGQLIFDADVKVDAKLDDVTETSVDLAPALKNGLGHVVVVVESKRPYKERWQREWVRQWVQITHIGISSREGRNGSLSLLAAGLDRGEPLEGVAFSVMGAGVSAASGKDGIAHIKGPIGPYGNRSGAGLLIARRGGESAFAPGLSGNHESAERDYRMFAFDDRELYKPGETVRVKGIIRSIGSRKGGDVTLPQELLGQTLRWTATDAQGAEIGKGTTKVDDAGGVFVSFPLKTTVNLGHASVSFEGPHDFSGSEGFQIQEFRRPEYEVSADTEGAPYFVGGSGVAAVHATYYAGGGLAAAETDWQVTRSEGHFTPPNRSEYRFGKNHFESWFYGYHEPNRRVAPTAASWHGRADARGTHRLRVDFDGTGEPFAMSLSFSASVADVNRQSWSAATTMLVHPARIYVGLKPEKPFLKAGDPIVLDVVAADVEGNLVAGRKVRIQSYREVSEEVRGKWVKKRLDDAACELTTTAAAAPKACSLGTKGAGQYVVIADVEDEKGKKSRTTLTLWATGGNLGNERSLRPGALELTADKSEYAPGQTVELLVKAPFAPAEGILQIDGGEAPREIRVHLTDRTQTLTFPVLAGDVPGLAATLNIVGAEPRLNEHGDVDPELRPKPAYAQASTNISVPPNDRNVVVTATPKAKGISPGGNNSVAVETKDAAGHPYPAEVAVIVVDEAVLALTGYTMADAKNELYTPLSYVPRLVDTRFYVTLAPKEQLHRMFGYRTEPDDAQQDGDRGGMWGDSIGDSFGFGGLGLSGVGEGGGGRGEGIGLGNIGTIGHGAGTGQGQGNGHGHGRLSGEARRAAPSNMSAPKVPAAEPPALRQEASEKAEPRKGGEGARPIALRSNFDALAIFAARVKTDDAGHAQVDFKMPESTTRYRVMVVAWDKGNRFGTGESTITTRQPLTVRPSAPRFLNYGDRFELPVVIQNQTDAKMRISLAARTMNATLLEQTGRAFEVAAGDRVEVRLPAAAHMPGRAHFQLVAGTDDFADAADVDLPVWSPGTTEAFATYGVVDDGAVGQVVSVPEGIEKTWGGLDISTASTALFALSDAVLYLTRYPFECNEQLASRVLAIASLKDMLAAFNSRELPPLGVLQGSVARDLELLRARQDPGSGGFGFWVSEPWPYLTIHVGFALSVAKQKGYAVDERLLAGVRRYLDAIESHIPSYYSPEARRSLIGYSLFVQKRLGSPNAIKAQSIIQESGGIDKTPMESLAWLLPTLAADTSTKQLAKDVAKHFENRASETAGAAHFTTSYGESDYLILASDHRTDALILQALLETEPGNVLIPKIVSGLLGARKKGHWQNTQDDAFVLLALDTYFQKFEKVAPSFIARVWLGDQTASEHTFRGYNTDRVQTEVPMPELFKMGKSDLVVQKEGKGRLYYRVGLRYAPADFVLPPLERGFSVTRTYESTAPKGTPPEVTKDDKGTWHVKAGATVRVRVTMVATSERHHVALVDPMPAGFEALNPALRVTGPIPQDTESSKRSSGWYWARSWYEHDNLRDERAEAFTSLLWAGAHEYVYTARATTPGNFVVPPAKAEEMYAPETFGRSGGDRVLVE